jgi:hypothetical protein
LQNSKKRIQRKVQKWLRYFVGRTGAMYYVSKMNVLPVHKTKTYQHRSTV